MNEARETQRTQFNAGIEYGKRAMQFQLREDAIAWFKSEVQTGTMAKDDAEGIFNGLANAIGWDEVESLNTLFTVVVSYNGDPIAEFCDIEANDADEAESLVMDNMDLEDVEVSFTVSYNGDTQSNGVSMTYNWSDDFEYNATEQ